MCGLAGVVGKRVSEARLAASQAKLVHRGPDGAGLWQNEDVALCHRRLAILDLSERGAQPMSWRGVAVAVHNGEIYNFKAIREELEAAGERFESESDTEVLLGGYAHWGIEGLLARIDGMFAFAIWDLLDQTLHIARDRLGEKPLFYYERSGSLSFASTVGALLPLLGTTPDVDLGALAGYLVHLTPPGSASILAGVMSLPAGHRLSWSREHGARIHRYWQIPQREHRPRVPNVLDAMDETIRDAVRTRLVADVPVGLFLSGGVDSSIVASYLSELGANTTAICARFDGPNDESSHAALVARELGLEFLPLEVDADIGSHLVWIAASASQPNGDHAYAPTALIARAARKQGIYVVLTGDGGDELFAGYQTAVEARVATWLRNGPPRLRSTSARAVERLLSHSPSSSATRFAQRLALALQDPPTWRFDPLGRQGFRGVDLHRILGSAWSQKLEAQVDEHWTARFRTSLGSFGERTQTCELRTLLQDRFLPKTDGATMAYSVEARPPLLAPKVVDLATSIPFNQKMPGLRTKPLLRCLLARRLPEKLANRRKQGFSPSSSQWLRSPAGVGAVHEFLLSSSSATGDFLERSVVRTLLDQHASGKRDRGLHLWSVLMLELWLRVNVHGTLDASESIAAT